MFRVFQYFIFQVAGSLKDFDPTQDMLLTPSRFLTYRRFDQVVPTAGKLYAGAIKDRQDADWMIWRFNSGLYQPNVDEWLEHLSYGSTSIGPWYESGFTGIFAPVSNRVVNQPAMYRQKLHKMEEFFRLYLNGGSASSPGGRGPVDKNRWSSAVAALLPSVLDAKGQLLRSDSAAI